MSIYEIGKEIADLAMRVQRLEARLDQRFRLVNRAGIVAALWIVAVLIFSYAGQAAVATAATVVKLLVVIK